MVKSNTASLIGRNWFSVLRLSVEGVKSVHLANYVAEFPDVLRKDLGTFRGPPVSFPFKDDMNPVILNARKVPFILKEKVNVELETVDETYTNRADCTSKMVYPNCSCVKIKWGSENLRLSQYSEQSFTK